MRKLNAAVVALASGLVSLAALAADSYTIDELTTMIRSR